MCFLPPPVSRVTSCCPCGAVLCLKENLGCAGWQHHPSFSSENTHKSFQASLWTVVITSPLRAAEMPSACMGRAALRAAWVLAARQVSHKGTGDEFSFLVTCLGTESREPKSVILSAGLVAFLPTGRISWLLSTEICILTAIVLESSMK